MNRRRFTMAVAALAWCATIAPAGAGPLTMSEWLANRIERFGALKAGDPDQPARIEATKLRTAGMVAAAGPLAAADAPPVIWRANDKPIVIFEDPVAPRMVVVPAGEFTMGGSTQGMGLPRRRRIRLNHAFAVSMFPIIVGEFASFVADSGYRAATSCITLNGDALRSMADRNWRNPGVTAMPRDPVTCVAYQDAVAYAVWLSKKTAHSYRLLRSAEYEYINRAGTTTTYWWGDDVASACTHGNGFDLDGLPYQGSPPRIACHDGQPSAAPVGKYKPNAFGLFDTSGNVESWTSDCGDARCHAHILRGGSWQGGDLSAASSHKAPGVQATSWRGFRLVRDL